MRDCLDLADLGHPLEGCLDYFEIGRPTYCGQHHSLAFSPQLYKIRKKNRLSNDHACILSSLSDCRCCLGASNSSRDAPAQ